MKTILCYGDSNTWGQNSEAEGRYPFDVRWTGLISERLSDSFRVIEEGLCGRTTAYELPLEEYRNGWTTLPMVLSAADPIDLIILMLGTNDRRVSMRVSPQESAIAMEKYIRMIRTPQHWFGHRTPEILLVAPPKISPAVLETEVDFYYDEHSICESDELSYWYERIAKQYGCYFLNAALYGETGTDGVHMSATGHKMLADAMVKKIQNIYGD